MPEGCTLEGCDNELGDGIRLTQNGVWIGGICTECLGSAKGAKLFLRKEDDGKFKLEEMQRIEKPF